MRRREPVGAFFDGPKLKEKTIRYAPWATLEDRHLATLEQYISRYPGSNWETVVSLPDRFTACQELYRLPIIAAREASLNLDITTMRR